MTYGYVRVSTKGQAKDGYSFEQQEQEILSSYPDAQILKESFTGKTTDRPVLNGIISRMEPCDKLIVTKLDRLARNTVEGIQTIQGLFERGISVHALNVGLLDNSPMGKFFLTTLLAVAEMERAAIIDRTQAGKEIAKQKPGYREGRPKKFNKEKIDFALELLKNGNSYKRVETITGISKSTLIRAKKPDSKRD